MADTADTILWSQDASGDHKKGNRRADSRGKREITDTEKLGREIVPLNSLEGAKKEPERINMARQERLMSILGGAALIAYGITRRDRAGWALALRKKVNN